MFNIKTISIILLILTLIHVAPEIFQSHHDDNGISDCLISEVTMTVPKVTLKKVQGPNDFKAVLNEEEQDDIEDFISDYEDQDTSRSVHILYHKGLKDISQSVFKDESIEVCNFIIDSNKNFIDFTSTFSVLSFD